MKPFADPLYVKFEDWPTMMELKRDERAPVLPDVHTESVEEFLRRIGRLKDKVAPWEDDEFDEEDEDEDILEGDEFSEILDYIGDVEDDEDDLQSLIDIDRDTPL
eukprot:tig00020912_g15806.t1